jgi:hypothetical protein
MRTVAEEGAHGGGVAVGGGKLQRGGAGRADGGRGDVPVAVGVVAGRRETLTSARWSVGRLTTRPFPLDKAVWSGACFEDGVYGPAGRGCI